MDSYGTSTVIDTDGAVVIITDSTFDFPILDVECLNLPDQDRAVKTVCGDEAVIVLGARGVVFGCSLEAPRRSFTEVSKLFEQVPDH